MSEEQREEQREERRHPWILKDGTPGSIHARLLKCIKDAASVLKDKEGSSAQDVIDTARAVFLANGVVPRTQAVNGMIAPTKGFFVTMTVTVHFCADDGSYWPVSADAGAMAPNMKSYAAVFTSGLKAILRHQLMLHFVTDEKELVASAMAPELRQWHDTLLTFRTLQELEQGAGHKHRIAVADADLGASRHMYAQRRDELRANLADDKLAYWEAKKAENDAASEGTKPTKRSKK